MADFLQDSLDFIQEGGAGGELYTRLSRIRSDPSFMAQINEEVLLRNLLSKADKPVVIDAFLVDDLYSGRLANIIALQVAKTVLTDDTLWKNFKYMHKAASLMDNEDDAWSTDGDIVQEISLEYGSKIDLVELNPVTGTHQLNPTQPGSEHSLFLANSSTEYQRGDKVSHGKEKILLKTPASTISVIWVPEFQDLHLSIIPPQCAEQTFMKGTIEIQWEKERVSPNRRDYSLATANAFFQNITNPQGGRLILDRHLLPDL